MKIRAFLFSVLVLAACNGESKNSPPDTEPESFPELKSWADYVHQLSIDKSNSGWRLKLSQPPTFGFDDNKSYYWVLVTKYGEIKIKLMPDVAPNHVSSTIFLTLLGYYDGLTFHRIMPGFMAQGGCPLGSGTGGPGYQYAGELDPDVKHSGRGILSMAHAGPGTDGSQFFITFKATPGLDGVHNVFGKVETGMKTLRALENRGIPGDSKGRTKERVTIDKAMIVVE